MAEICCELHEKAHKLVRNIVFNQVWLIACYGKCLGPYLVDISIVAYIFLPCATGGTGGTNFKVTVS